MTVLSSTDRDNAEKKVKSSYFDLPAMNVFVAFPQATPASKFPTCTSDYYHFSELLTPEEQAVRKSEGVHGERSCPHYDRGLSIFVFVCLFTLILSLRDIILLSLIFTHQYWEKAEFPFHIIPKLGALGVVGGSIKGYGCPGHITANAIATAEISRVDASCGTFNLVLSLEKIVEFLGTGEVVRIKTTNGWCLPVDSLPSHVPKDVCTVKKPHNG
ncbi:hypothetical protein IGI04_023796 [Brassica rapa subsp. trilocularis]|uniref:Acyl-CoA dehydrogenase/oxidase N-terminal domain-containing protein n=1 Tax=Brassica rapa subsp. trilocularis TaxID=1813537 RepID=A0ABQ7M4W0_BRACM|nr:hypothetical protein IGI04_023796 [Brassica rapa subsp. trilocularis]